MMIALVIVLGLINLILWSDIFYRQFFKRFYDIICALLALILFCWLYVLIAFLVRIKLGSPIIFSQVRPGKKGNDGNEILFTLYKFRTMTDERDDKGNLLPDSVRLTKFGSFLRSTSLDEIPEAINILRGDMSVVGPRPQLVRDMVFMTNQQRIRHTIRPGITGLAQVKGRNAITWEEKLEWDLKYIEKISFFGDLKILFHTLIAVVMRKGITDGENATALDYGDDLLKDGKISKDNYDMMQARANTIIEEHKNANGRKVSYGNKPC